ncbi:unnamed protein product, partial [Brassica oleracea]
MPSQPNHLEEILCRGHCSSIVEVRLLRFWEARTFKRGGELMGWICFSLCQGFPIFDNFTFSFLQVVLSDSATTSTKDYRDSNISGREAMQRSDDITINSTASVKRRGKGPIVEVSTGLFTTSSITHWVKLHEELFSPETTGPGSDHRSSPATRCLGAPSTEPTHRIIEGNNRLNVFEDTLLLPLWTQFSQDNFNTLLVSFTHTTFSRFSTMAPRHFTAAEKGKGLTSQADITLCKRNKITPSFYRPVPPMQDTRKHRFQRSRSPVRQWREKTRSHDELLEARAGISKTPPCADPLEDSVTSRPLLERNLELTDYPHLPRIPLREEVMEDLREVTFQYTNVTDPIEAAARLQRVIRSEEEGLMEETTSRIIVAAANNLRQYEDRDRALPEEETRVQSTPMARSRTGRTLNHTPRSTRNARERSGASRRTQASPRIFAGTNLRRRNIAQSASKHGFPHAAPIHSSQGRAHIPTSTEPAL